jgi:predicted transcriptional regulator
VRDLILSSVPGHLAFAEFDGVSLIEPDSLGNLFYSIMKNPEDFLNFNRQNRRIACEKKFGYSVIENEISTILECIIN